MKAAKFDYKPKNIYYVYYVHHGPLYEFILHYNNISKGIFN